MKKILSITWITLLILSTMLLMGCNSEPNQSEDTVKYGGKEYVYLELPANIFYHYYNGNSHDNFEEVDGTYPIDSPKWDMVWVGGDLYCAKDSVEEAVSYYANDDNYVWYALVDRDIEDNEINSCPIDITDTELTSTYDIENKEKTLAVYFEDFEKLGSLFKISKDGVVRGTITIGKYKGDWYWRSETIDENTERDGTWAEYIQPLEKSLSDKITEAE